MELNDVSKELEFFDMFRSNPFKAKIIMVIKAPKGICLLFDRPYNLDEQGDAIKAFMEQHRND